MSDVGCEVGVGGWVDQMRTMASRVIGSLQSNAGAWGGGREGGRSDQGHCELEQLGQPSRGEMALARP